MSGTIRSWFFNFINFLCTNVHGQCKLLLYFEINQYNPHIYCHILQIFIGKTYDIVISILVFTSRQSQILG